MGDRTTGVTITDIDDTTCYEVTHQFCTRFTINFPNSPGPLSLLEVDTHDATGGVTAAYTPPSQVSYSCDGNAACSISTTDVILDASANLFYANDRIKVTCAGKTMGTYTVASTTTTQITTVETLTACTPVGTETVTVVLDSYVITTNADLTSFVSPGALLNIGTFSGITPKVDFITWDATAGTGRIYLTGEHVGDDANSAETITTAGTDVVEWYGAGTTEDSECGDRGLCNRETGICKCFVGYTGEACSLQNALSA